MDKRTSRYTALIFIPMLCFATALFFYLDGEASYSNASTDPYHYLPYQYSTFSEDSAYYIEAITHSRSNVSVVTKHRPSIRAGIISHHLLIKELIAEYFSLLTGEISPSTIILVGPNHRSRGDDPVAISMLPWKTPFGIVQTDRFIAEQMVKTNLVKINEDAFYNEHSIGSLVPFIRYFFPSARIVSIIIKPDADTATILDLALWLSKNLSGNSIIIGSLDFSHYHPSNVAEQQDSITLDVIRSFQIERWKQAFTDSRKTLLLLLSYAKHVQSTQFEIIHHTNSGMVMNELQEPCTSYINSIFQCQSKE